MKNVLTASLFVFATTTLLAAGAPGISGKWKVHNNISGNESDQECMFAQKDKELSGSCKNDANVDLKLAGTIDGKSVTWKYDSEYNGTPLTLTYTGTLEDSGNIKGEVKVDPFGVSGDFTATPQMSDGGTQK